MNVREIRMVGFTEHKDTVLQLPERGVVLLTGANGAGKSSAPEAVSTAIYGRTLRGRTERGFDPWPAGERGPCLAAVKTDLFDAARARRGDKKALAWNLPGAEPVKWESTTKAQEALELVAGPLDVWRRTSAFSTRDAPFGEMTDGQRKRLLDRIAGVDRFDAAAERCSAVLSGARRSFLAAESEVRVAEVERRNAEQRAEEAARRLAGARKHLEESGPAPEAGLEEKAVRLQGAHKKAAAMVDSLLRQKAELARFPDDLEAALRALKRADLGPTCPTCKRPFDEASRKAMTDKIVGCEKELRLAREKEAAAVVVYDEQLEEIRRDRDDLDAKIRGVEAKIAGAAAQRALLARVKAVVADAEKSSAAAAADREKAAASGASAEASFAAARARVALLEVVAEVLGLRGVRAQVLARALPGIEAVANGWLVRFAEAGTKILLRPYSEKADGGVSDAISLKIERRGEARDYDSFSGGQARRIDVALLLAMREVSAAAHGVAPGTVFFDEVFDALDAEGTEAICRVLEELARDRCVVVISHSEDLASRIRAVAKYRAEGGILRAA